MEIVEIDEHAASGGFDHMTWFTEKSMVPTFSVVQFWFEGPIEEMEKFKIRYEVEE